RLVRTGDDWDQVLALACDELTEENPGVVDFWRWRQAGFRDLALRGLGQWWGVWDGPVLVASAGFFGTAPWGRFQEVVTRASHRRQGICAGLCSAMVRDYFVRVPEG